MIPSTIRLSCKSLSFVSSGALTSSRFLAKDRAALAFLGWTEEETLVWAAPWNRPTMESLTRTRVLWPVGCCSTKGVVEGGVGVVVVVVVVMVVVVVVVVVVSGVGVATSSLMGSVV